MLKILPNTIYMLSKCPKTVVFFTQNDNTYRGMVITMTFIPMTRPIHIYLYISYTYVICCITYLEVGSGYLPR